MKLEGCTALVTGANRGLGSCYVEALLAAGAAKVYAGARNPATLPASAAIPIELDITDGAQVAAAARTCGDLTVLVNNAGILLDSPMLAEGSAEVMRAEFEVNVFGTLGMIQAFAPVLATNGGGTIINVLSITSWITSPLIATYSASKHAELAVTDAARIQLRAQGTRVIGVYAGYIDTNMARWVGGTKTQPADVAARTLEAIEAGVDHVMADRRAHDVWQARCSNPVGLEADMQAIWDKHRRNY